MNRRQRVEDRVRKRIKHCVEDRGEYRGKEDRHSRRLRIFMVFCCCFCWFFFNDLMIDEHRGFYDR